MSAPTIKGEKQEVKNGLFAITADAEQGKLIAFWNSTKDLQFNMTYQFLEPQVTALGETQSQDDKYAVVVYPGETKEFVTGKWKAYKRSFSFGAPDKAWVEKQAAQLNEGVEAEVAAVKAAVKANPKADGKYTAEYIASVCEAAGVPFVDLTYAPKPQAISREWEGAAPGFAWMRPSAYCTDPSKPPCLFVGDIEPNDIDQGRLGNCYFLCALACISEFPDVIKECFNQPQNSELGVYRVRICKNGWWQIVTLDDLLPTERNVPVYAKNREEPNELWVSMIEKAYAKLHGSYAAIRAGDPAMALADMVGGPYLKFKDHPAWDGDDDAFYKFLMKCDDDDHLMTLGTPGSDTTNYAGGGGGGGAGDAAALADKYKAVGLVTGHAFSLIRVKEYKGKKLCMIRNPWGNGLEWNGKWGDNDPDWTPEMKKALDFYEGDDGTFWMEWADVRKWFEGGAVCFHLASWSRIRVAANFEQGIPDLILQVTVSKAPVEVWFGAHQRDNRGLPTGDPDRKYAGLLVSVLHADSASGRMSAVLSSNKGNFAPARDAFANGTLEPSDKPYYVLVQAYAQETKSFVISGFFDDDKNVKVAFVTYRDGAAKKCNPPSTFDAATASQKAAANYQLVTKRTNKQFLELQGDSVNFAMVPDAGKAPAAGARGPAKDAKAPAAAAAKAPASSLAKKVVSAASKIKLSVNVLAGRNLAACDLNGLSDPYVTISVLDAAGKPVPGTDEVSTKYINNTLNPTWGEQFSFAVPEGGQLSFHCWDKDLFGKDDMGTVVVPVASLG
eukprot:CAMPEP_0174837028 /NCGR_PEP_ID=MMETSP1114-20130205/6463_1 /TAXON_ID=312471 /ORGANISM="Neobodo designis, Strain CCAP 1951/1" /LENGTH=782 /DNA_ID=CAMNT_0016071063 /DNA_START=28 /DNA_END=2372 /DNA_ORIENTATION=-